MLPTTAQSKPQGGEVVAVGDGRTVGNKKVEINVQVAIQVLASGCNVMIANKRS